MLRRERKRGVGFTVEQESWEGLSENVAMEQRPEGGRQPGGPGGSRHREPPERSSWVRSPSGLIGSSKDTSMAAMEWAGAEVRGHGAEGQCLGDEVQDRMADCDVCGFPLE